MRNGKTTGQSALAGYPGLIPPGVAFWNRPGANTNVPSPGLGMTLLMDGCFERFALFAVPSNRWARR
jgi:hypothetical protein